MTLWRNDIERDAWIETNCRRCYQADEANKRVLGQGPGCPLLAHAATGRKPVQWTKRRDAAMGYTYKCDWYRRVPDVNRRGQQWSCRSRCSTSSPKKSITCRLKAGRPSQRKSSKKRKGITSEFRTQSSTVMMVRIR